MGFECLLLPRFHRPEIILLDLNMPEINGFTTCQLTRAENWSKYIKIIAATGLSGERLRARTHALGFDVHIVTPVDPEELAIHFVSLGHGRPVLH